MTARGAGMLPIRILLALSLLLWARATTAQVVVDTARTVALVYVGEGTLTWGNDLTEDMDIAFGVQLLPSVEATTDYAAINDSLTLVVKDQRGVPSPWTLRVSASPFVLVGESSSFVGILSLPNPDPLAQPPRSKIVLSSVDRDVVILTNDTSETGEFSFSFRGSEIGLSISSSEAAKVVASQYRATLTWTLSVEP